MNKPMTAANGHSRWQAAIRQELKTDDLERYLQRRLREGVSWPLLATAATPWAAPVGGQAALSHTWVREPVDGEVARLGARGVWDFIFDPFLLGWDDAATQEWLAKWRHDNTRLWVLAAGPVPAGAQSVLHVTGVWARGGHAVHELAGLLDQVICWARAPQPAPVGVALTMDREYFKSIAKTRALKAMVLAALKELGREELWDSLTFIARSSWRDFTALDPASNILRNATALAAAYVSGAQVVESLPHDLLLVEQTPAAAHLALAGQLVLQQEALLSEVDDAAQGAFAIEDMTRQLAEAAWALMQQMQGMDDATRWLEAVAAASWQEVARAMRTRRLVQAGVNDFPEACAHVALHARFTRSDHVRTAAEFEGLRLRAQGQSPLRVALVVAGEWAALQARLNFARNVFELIGAQVIDPGRALANDEADEWLSQQQVDVWAWVAADGVAPMVPLRSTRAYVAGKTTPVGFLPLHAGMDVVTLLTDLLDWREDR